jgi:hypothetical protein
MGSKRNSICEQKHSPEQMVRILRQVEVRLAAGAVTLKVIRELGIRGATFHRSKETDTVG